MRTVDLIENRLVLQKSRYILSMGKLNYRNISC